MRIAALAFGLFLAAFLLHWIIWRVRIPRRQTAALLVILLAFLPVGLAAAAFLPALQFLAPIGFWEVVHVSMFHVALSLAYIVAYTAIEGRSPSMALLVYVADARGQGRTRGELESVLRGGNPVAARLQAMLLDGMVVQADGLYRLTPKGWAWARTLGCFRNLLGMEKGG
jgi:hypothetical protein